MVGCGRHGGERPNLPGRVGVSAIVEGRLLQSEALFCQQSFKINFISLPAKAYGRCIYWHGGKCKRFCVTEVC